MNVKIATVQKRACGYSNPNNFKIAVNFHCGDLNLHPTAMTHTKVGRTNNKGLAEIAFKANEKEGLVDFTE